MPINISDYNWSQTEEKVAVTLKLPSLSHKEVDIFYTTSYIKVSQFPYIFEAFLTNKINTEESKALLIDGKIEFTLKKNSNSHWESLSRSLEKDHCKILRLEAQKEFENEEHKKLMKIKEQKRERDQFSVSQQLSIDDKVRETRKNLIEQQKREFFSNLPSQDISDFRRRHSSTCSEDGIQRPISEADYDGDGEDGICCTSGEDLARLNIKVTANRKQRRSLSNRGNKKSIADVPPVRQSTSVKVSFTPRAFPTPSRESMEDEELEILKSGQEKAIKTSDNDLEFFKNKGVSLFGNGDFLGCVNAFDEAMKINPGMAALYSNRAAAYLALKKFSLAFNDCTKALELLTPTSEGNKKSRSLCHIRRGTALVQLNKYHQAYSEYEMAIRLDPGNPAVARDAEAIREKLIAVATTTESEGTSGSGEESDEICEESPSMKGLPKI